MVFMFFFPKIRSMKLDFPYRKCKFALDIVIEIVTSIVMALIV
jgi:hypothetical protein